MIYKIYQQQNIVIYKHIPKTSPKTPDICPLCKRRMKKSNAVVDVYSPQGTGSFAYKESIAKLYFCSECQIHFATPEMFREIREQSGGFYADGFFVQRKSTRESVIIYCEEEPELILGEEVKALNKLPNEESAKPHHKAKIQNETKKSQYDRKVIHVSNCDFSSCPICHKKTNRTTIKIPISETEEEICYLWSCGVHYFTDSSKELDLLMKNSFAKNTIMINKDYYFKALNTSQIDSIAKENSGLILLLRSEIGKKLVLVISSHSAESSGKIIYLDYRTQEARDILTEIFKDQESESEIDFRGDKYAVFFAEGKEHENPRPEYILKKIFLRDGCGYRYGNTSGELVDALLYSPFTNRYEIVHTTYLKEDDEYCMDISIYKNFVMEFGNPGIIPIASNYSGRYGGNNFDDLQVESLLHAFGYNVNKADNLSDRERQDTLSMVIDLELMEQKNIVRFIDWLISTHPSDRYREARHKWKKDKEYVMNYEANPERFIIAVS